MTRIDSGEYPWLRFWAFLEVDARSRYNTDVQVRESRFEARKTQFRQFPTGAAVQALTHSSRSRKIGLNAAS